jgi:DNA-binding transcriptional MerR regulator
MVKIGEIAERVGVNPKTIRFYESVGVMPEPPRTPAEYRDYEEEDVTRL